MPVHGLDHVTLNSSDVGRTCEFYERVMGFRVQRMSGRGYDGAWLLLGDHPYLHVMPTPPGHTVGPVQVDHFALQATSLAETRRHLKAQGIEFRDQPLPEFGLHQLVFRDPDNVKVELNFRMAVEAAVEEVDQAAA
jgi:catechol 2,3-dioxygenase-like lactoylglutathione lyase family enzyme